MNDTKCKNITLSVAAAILLLPVLLFLLYGLAFHCKYLSYSVQVGTHKYVRIDVAWADDTLEDNRYGNLIGNLLIAIPKSVDLFLIRNGWRDPDLIHPYSQKKIDRADYR